METITDTNSTLESSAPNSTVFDSVTTTAYPVTTNISVVGLTSHDTSRDTVVGLTGQDEAFIYATALVVLVAIVAVILRITVPKCRLRFQKEDESQIPFQFQGDKQISSSLKHSNTVDSDLSGISSSSAASSWSSSYDWSDYDTISDVTRNTEMSLDSRYLYTPFNGVQKTSSFGNMKGSTLSLPVYLPSQSFKVLPSFSTERLNEELMTTLSRKKSIASITTRESSIGSTTINNSDIESIGNSVYNNRYKEKMKNKDTISISSSLYSSKI